MDQGRVLDKVTVLPCAEGFRNEKVGRWNHWLIVRREDFWGKRNDCTAGCDQTILFGRYWSLLDCLTMEDWREGILVLEVSVKTPSDDLMSDSRRWPKGDMRHLGATRCFARTELGVLRHGKLSLKRPLCMSWTSLWPRLLVYGQIGAISRGLTAFYARLAAVTADFADMTCIAGLSDFVWPLGTR